MNGLQYLIVRKQIKDIQNLILSRFRGVSKEDPQKIIVIHQAPEGNVQKFVEANGDWMSTHRVDLSTMEESSWTPSLTKGECCD